jgi:glutathione S-transferase
MITLWELRGDDDRRYSNFAWRTRMALRHKGLEAAFEPVLLTDKATIAFSGGKTVPVLRDGDTVVRDSWQIAEHLERTYPERPSLFGGPAGHGLCLFVNAWVDRSVLAAAFPALACDAIAVQDAADRDYFRATVEKITGLTPGALKDQQPKNVERLSKAVEPARATLKRQAFLGGAQPCYADYSLASVFQWARIVSPVAMLAPDDPLAAWFGRILDLHDGAARRTPAFR